MRRQVVVGADWGPLAEVPRPMALPEARPHRFYLRKRPVGPPADRLNARPLGLSLPYSNGPIEGTNTKFKLLKRQMYGRAGFALLRQRILLS